MTSGERLQAAYEQALRGRGRVEDACQRQVVARLAQLSCALDAPLPRRGLLGALGLGGTVPAPPGLYLWGGVGRGKTWLMDLFHGVALGGRGERSHFNHFMRDAHQALAGLRGGPRPLQRLAAQIARRTRLLCLDELAVNDIGDAMILHGLFAGLIAERVTLVITSNLPPSALYQGGLQRERFLPAITLLETALDVLHLDGGTDYRMLRRELAGTYLLGDEAATAVRMRALFLQLAEDAPATAAGDSVQMLDIEGRQIPARAVCGGTVWFDFNALCEGPRGTADYIAIADRFDTVLLSGVPAFGPQQDDAARRFISLVDEFYDRGTRLVVAAAADPDHLYRGERLAFAFARTASRLVEMRSRAYLARRR
ncbi:MAG: hypothetical protein RL026_472 [Pseudomonadota bacterium]